VILGTSWLASLWLDVPLGRGWASSACNLSKLGYSNATGVLTSPACDVTVVSLSQLSELSCT